MSYVALYRQWRPKTFAELVGQQHISVTLQNAVAAKRIAHAYLFTGPRGTGKTSTAKILARALNCVAGPTPNPCNQCASCRSITDGTSLDVLEIDAASNRGIDEIRDLREKVKFAPVDSRYKVYIIDEVHMLTPEAFNALLKTLEEPPLHVVFVLATTEPHKVPATILSRCQRYDFHRIGTGDIAERLRTVAASHGVHITDDAVNLIACQAEGGLRDALSILDQCIAYGGEHIDGETVSTVIGTVGVGQLYALGEVIAQKDVAGGLRLVQDLISAGRDARQILAELVWHFRQLLLVKVAGPDAKLQEGFGGQDEQLSRQAAYFTADQIMGIMELLAAANQEARWSGQPRVQLELALVRACRGEADELAGLKRRIERLEQILAQQPAPEGRPATEASRFLPRTGSQEPPVDNVTTSPTGSLPSSLPGVNLEGLWEQVLQELLKRDKRAMHACVSEGKLLGVSNGQVSIGFATPILKERTERNDYRTFLEKLFTQVLGTPCQLRCCLLQDKAPVPPPAAPATADPLVQKALELFGGEVVEIDNISGEDV